MLHHLPSRPIRSLCIAGILALSAQIPAHAAVTLTIDTLAKTFTWSGTATSEAIVIPEDSMKSIRLGTGSWIGGTLVSNEGDGSLAPSLIGGSGVSVMEGSFNGIPIVAGSQNSVYMDLAMLSYIGGFPEGPTLAALTITADEQVYSYAGLNGDALSYFESLDGTQLFFQDNQGGAGVFNIGSAAGQIVVVPEPSGALFLLAAPLCFSFRRRRA
ncbi:hypothetical protein [Luteolibacter luteus]|uniref:PEP-CTERM sorting domain-containing protein n=1 Tax=Luteolibacter luteus TaxID=2728835 RepID=A0A858RMK9_9BACT|nr:hypothetical protein [Luteolibacter luteus]QJE97945.1 hypothetical protein HHL09_19860 [Luteolibacter luteus]